MVNLQNGCFARITSMKDKGTLVHVGKFLGSVPNWMFNDHWVIDKPVYTNSTNDVVYHISAQYLERVVLDDTPCGKSYNQLIKEIKGTK